MGSTSSWNTGPSQDVSGSSNKLLFKLRAFYTSNFGHVELAMKTMDLYCSLSLRCIAFDATIFDVCVKQVFYDTLYE